MKTFQTRKMHLGEASILGTLHKFSSFQMEDRGYHLQTPESICLALVRKRLDFSGSTTS